jgi:DNA-binding NarL/FixJ family response regulator
VARSVVPEAQIHAETSLAEALERARELRADLELVLLDLGLPGCAGIEALTRFRVAAPTVRIVVISANEDPATVEAAIQAGAAGYIPKTTMPQQMVAALRLILSGGVYLPMQVMETTQPGTVQRARKAPTMDDLGLTGRQADVMRLLLKGLAYRDIARQLKIAESTVKQHCHALYRTLGVNSRTEAFIALARKGIKLD